MKHIQLFSFLLATIFILGSIPAKAQRSQNPKWTEYQYRNSKFPASFYLVGFTSDESTGTETVSELTDRLKSAARTQLIESIHVDIRSMTTTNITNINAETNMYFKQTSVSLTKVELSNLQTDTYYDKKEGIGYAIAYVKKSDVSSYYLNKIENLKEKLNLKIAEAQQLQKANDKQNALITFNQCNNLFREAEAAHTLIIAFEKRSITDPQLHFKTFSEQKQIVQKAIRDLQKNTELSLDDVAFFMAYNIRLMADSIQQPIELNIFTYQDSKMASTFSKRFDMSFEQELVNAGYRIKRNVNPLYNDKPPYTLSGTYWEDGQYIKIIALLRSNTTGESVASVEGLMPAQWLRDRNIDIKPANYNFAFENFVKFNQTNNANGNLQVLMSTNKGDENLVFAENDTLKLYIKANKACYLRLIYHLADGSKVLLLDNYRISNELANQVYEIPQYFVCAPPFGIETLQVNAQTQKFMPLKIQSQYGYDFILGNLDEILENTRGFVPTDSKGGTDEKRLTVTTMQY